MEASEENNRKKVVYMRHIKLNKVFCVRFENEQRQHRIMFGKLMHNYMVVNNKIDIKKFVFGMVHLFKTKMLLGKKKGYLSKKAFILMLLTWMIDRDFITGA